MVSEPKAVTSINRVSPSDKPRETPSIFGRKEARRAFKEEAEPAPQEKSDEFSQEDLQSAWNSFGKEQTNLADTNKLILNREIRKGDNHEVILQLTSSLEVSFLEKVETELVQFLRSVLRNDYITLKSEILKNDDDSKKLYTSKDIFDYMLKQNANIKDLKDRLGLDFDY